MKLVVKFTGLCLFVPVPEHNVMHVLFPATGGHADVHKAALTCVDVHKATLTCNGTSFDLKDRLLDLSGTSQTQSGDWKIEGAFDVREILDERVDARQLGAEPSAAVVARVTLPLGDRPKVGKTARYRYRFKRKSDGRMLSRKRRLSNEFEWTYRDLQIPPEKWQLTALRGDAGPKKLPALGKDDIVIQITHLPAKDPDIEQNDPVHHAHAYYEVYLPPEHGPLPILDEPPQPLFTKGRDGGSPFNCMGGVGGP